MTELVPLAVAAAVAALLSPGALRSFEAYGWTRTNWRGRALPFPAGAVAVTAGILALGLLAAADELLGTTTLREPVDTAAGRFPTGWTAYAPLAPDAPAEVAPHATAALPLLLGVAVLGLLDDLLDAPARGWRGHAAALLRGAPTTGALKAAGTLALALAAFAGAGLGVPEYLLAVAVVVLATNLFNLLDLRPGRSVKAFVLLGAGLLAGTGELEPLRPLGLFAGPLLVLGLYDLRERAMLGDTGSNLLGALAGLWLVLALDTMGQVVALVTLAALTVYGELRSITAAIERIAPLRAVDRLGRPGGGA